MKLKTYFGISAGFHDAAVSVIQSDGSILFAGHTERYSKNKNDAHLNDSIIAEAMSYATPDVIAYYERPWVKKLQQLYSGQYEEAFDFGNFTLDQYLRKHLSDTVHRQRLLRCPRKYMSHHHSHAAAGFQSSPYNRATVVVIDAIGELDTVTIWGAEYDRKGMARYKRLWTQHYPHSIGLFYSAVTGRVGLRPLDEEYILMGMSAYGNPNVRARMQLDLVDNEWEIRFRENLHTGLDSGYLSDYSDMDLAAGAQHLVEDLILNVMARAKQFHWSKNLVYMGGVALNCAANARIGGYFDDIWIMPNPGDAGSSLGAAALAHGGKLNWTTAYLGHNIPGPYPVTDIIEELTINKIVGVASGRAEFGPRALGNRSLLADPRGADIKDRVNDIKRRQQFRPFAPVILEEHVDMYFDMPRGFHNSRYMQVIARCRHPHIFPAIVHRDGTSRVQTVPPDGSGIRQLLEEWYKNTGCPMLLNTSLNIRGEPMVNDRADADRFKKLYGITVCT